MPIASNLATKHNNITFSSYFNKDLLLRSSIDLDIIINQVHKSINIDLKDLTKCFASAILPFAVNCRALLLSGIDIRLELPSDPQLSRLFRNCNWAHLIDPRQYDPSD